MFQWDNGIAWSDEEGIHTGNVMHFMVDWTRIGMKAQPWNGFELVPDSLVVTAWLFYNNKSWYGRIINGFDPLASQTIKKVRYPFICSSMFKLLLICRIYKLNIALHAPTYRQVLNQNKGAFTLILSEQPCLSQCPSFWQSFVHITSKAWIGGHPWPWPFW